MRSASRCWPTFFTVIPQTPSMVVITYRPEYEGTLTRVHGAQTIALAPAE